MVNGDDPGAVALVRSVGLRPGRVTFAGTSDRCGVRATRIERTADRLRFTLLGVRCEVRACGSHFLPLACCAVAAGAACGVPAGALAAGLARFEPVAGRCRPVRFALPAGGAATVIDDTYNAPPEGFLAAVDVLAAWPVPPGGRRWLAAGGMRELGGDAVLLHCAVGGRAAAAGIDVLIGVGVGADGIAAAARSHGGCGEVVSVASAAEAAGLLAAGLRAGDAALVKGCRADGLERVLAELAARLRPGGGRP